jgi:hypothetical protein
MLQVFHLNVAKLDRDVAYTCKCFGCFHTYIAGVFTHVFKFLLVFCKYFKHMLQVFHLFRMYVVNVSSECCKSSGACVGAQNAGSDGNVLD